MKSISPEQAKRWMNAANKILGLSGDNIKLVTESLNRILSGQVPQEESRRVRLEYSGKSCGPSQDIACFDNKSAVLVSFGGLPEMAYADAVPVDHLGRFDTVEAKTKQDALEDEFTRLARRHIPKEGPSDEIA